MRIKYVLGPPETFISGRAFTPDQGPIKLGDEVEVHDLDGQQLVDSGAFEKVEAKDAEKKQAIAKPSKTGKVEEVQSQQ